MGAQLDPSRLTLEEHQCQVHVVAVHLSRSAAAAHLGREATRRRRSSSPSRTTSAPTSRRARSGWTAVRILPNTPRTPGMGFSTGKWQGDMLTVTTTHIKQGWHSAQRAAAKRPGDDDRTLHPAWQHPHPHQRRHRSGVSDGAVDQERQLRVERACVAGAGLALALRAGGRGGESAARRAARWTCRITCPARILSSANLPSVRDPPEAVLGGAETMYPGVRHETA